MTHQNQVRIKLGKSLARLKEDLISSKKLLTQYALPTDAQKLLPNAHPTKNCEHRALGSPHFQPNKLDISHQTRNTNTKENKHVFGRIVDFAKSMVNSKMPFTVKHHQVRHLVTIINEAQIEKDYQKSRSMIYQTKHPPSYNNFFKPSLRYGFQTPISSRTYSSESSSPPGRHRYHEDVENAMNQQILAELNASYAYLSMACYFGRTEVALPGCHGFFMQMHEEEHEHALTFINYQNMRGGHVTLCPVTAPECQNWESIRRALCVAVEMEKLVKEKLMALNKVAEEHNDLSVMDLITSNFIPEQERSICEFSRLLVRANKMVECGMSEYLFDKEIHRAFVKKSGKTFDTKPNAGNKDKSNVYV